MSLWVLEVFPNICLNAYRVLQVWHNHYLSLLSADQRSISHNLKAWVANRNLYEHALMNVQTTHEGGLHVAELKSTNCLQIHSVMAGSVIVLEGTVVWKFPALSLCQDLCFFTVLCYFPHFQLQLCIHLIPSYVRKHQKSWDSRLYSQEKFRSNACQWLYRFTEEETSETLIMERSERWRGGALMSKCGTVAITAALVVFTASA